MFLFKTVSAPSDPVTPDLVVSGGQPGGGGGGVAGRAALHGGCGGVGRGRGAPSATAAQRMGTAQEPKSIPKP